MNKSKEFRLGFHPFLFLFGYKRIGISKNELEALLNLCRKSATRYWAISASEEYAELCIPFFSARRLSKEAVAVGLSPKEIKSGGLPAIILRHKGRFGIPVGIALALLIIILSGQVIWDIRIEGAQKISKEEVEATLEQCGLRIGTAKSKLDIDVIENRVLILSDSISWISINVRGTVANVELREIDFPPDIDGDTADLISNGEGTVLRTEDVRGNLLVTPGDTVTQGQLLIGSAYGNGMDPFKQASPKGKVFAECEDSFSVSIPRVYQKKVYSNKVKCEKYLVFFKKEIKFFGNCGNLPSTCDKIEMVEYLRSPSGNDLPIGIKTVSYREYSYTEESRSDEEMTELAVYRMSAEISKAIPDAEILRIQTDFLLSDSSYTLTKKIRCIRNIAVRKKIDREH